MLQSREVRTKLVWVDSKNYNPKVIKSIENNIKYKMQQKIWYDKKKRSEGIC